MIQIITDSMSDITQADSKKHHVQVLAQNILFGDESFIDGITIDIETFYNKLSTAAQLPKTSQVAPEAFQDAIAAALMAGNEVLIITGSSGLSGTYQSALIAKQAFDSDKHIHIVDSLSAALGETFLVMEAVRLRDLGTPVEQIVETLENLKLRQKLYGYVADLKYLVMGGRLSSFGGKAGNILKIRPMLELSDGTLSMSNLVRGKKKMLEWFLDHLKTTPPDLNYPIYFASANANDALMELVDYLKEKTPQLPLIAITHIGPIIGTHVGPGTLALQYIAK